MPAARAGTRASVVRLIGAVLWVDSIFYAAIVPMLGRLSAELGIDARRAGLLVGAYSAAMVVAAFPVAWLAARWSGRSAVIAGLALMSSGCLLFGVSDSVTGLVVARALQGVGSAVSWVGGLAWIAQIAPAERRAELFGTALGIGLVGTQLGPVMGVLAAAVGRAPAFSLGVLAGGLLTVWAVRLPASVNAEAASGFPVAALRDGEFVAGLWLTGAPSICLGVIDVLSPLSLSARGVGPLVIGCVFFAAAGLLALASRVTGRAIDRSGPGVPARVAVVGSVASLTVLALTTHPIVLALGVVLASAFLGSLWGPGMHMLSRAARRRRLDEAYASGAFMWSWAVGFTVGSLLSGVVATAIGASAPYVFASVLCLPIMLVALHREQHEPVTSRA
jgi:predicted MFS family arabinose efflux permease